ncbi:MAG: hypothetical protein N3E39_03840 [Candidatus Methanomethylicia archaeon]|nr:hypothetical protein [Candidatus Methanomethylicia archaeon]
MKEELRKIHTIAKEKGLKILIFFKDSKYLLYINSLIKAEDKNFNPIIWTMAFGRKAPHEVISALKIEKIEVELRSKELMTFYKWEDFVRWVFEILKS